MKNIINKKLTNNMINANEWLERWYPKNGTCLRDNEAINQITGEIFINNFGKRRDEIKKLQIDKLNLAEVLDLSDFVNLEELWCWNNGLINVLLPESNQLEAIYVNNNQLTDFNYNVLNSNTLKVFRIDNNNLKCTDIKVFKDLVSLKSLEIGNTSKWVNQGNAGNQFYGSLESLQNLTELKELSIKNTNVDNGLEYLSNNLKYFNCWGTKLANILDSYSWGTYGPREHMNYLFNIGNWNAGKITDLEYEYSDIFWNLTEAFSLNSDDFWWTRDQLTLNTIYNPNQAFYYWLVEKIRMLEKLKVENEEYYSAFEISW